MIEDGHLLTICLDRLLDLLSQVLSGQYHKPLGVPSSVGRSDTTNVVPSVAIAQVSFGFLNEIILYINWPITKVPRQEP